IARSGGDLCPSFMPQGRSLPTAGSPTSGLRSMKARSPLLRSALRPRPAARNLHSHAFQRAFAGLAEARGRETDTFWTWRETMYRFALMMSPDDVEAVAAQVYVEMLEAGFAAVAEFHYLHN